MALSLAKDKLNYSPAQLDDLSIKLRLGDLTPILQIYEKDIKNPVRSAISGTLLRTLFVQIQKAKVRFSPSPALKTFTHDTYAPLRSTSTRHSQGSTSY
jgi:hypothetical protein